jgi:LAGLIDADG endonuclease
MNTGKKRYYEIHKRILFLSLYNLYNRLDKVNQQETLAFAVLPKAKGSSETARRITFQFKNYSEVKPEHKTQLDKHFLEWFIGFVEGLGSFVVSNQKVYFDLTQHIRDIQLLYRIKTALGFGSILTRTSNMETLSTFVVNTKAEGLREVGVYYVTGKSNFRRLVHLFNGNLVSAHKKSQFKAWLTVYNSQYNEKIPYLESFVLPSFENGWLSGFIDAEGRFRARVKDCRTSKLGRNLFVDFFLAQKSKDTLILVKDLFNIKKSENIRYDPSWEGYEFYLSNKKKQVCLVHYLNTYPLKTTKVLDFTIWSKIHNLSIKKEPLSSSGLNKVTKLCATIRGYKKKLEG